MIKGVSTGILQDMIEAGKISKEELQKRQNVAQALVENSPPDTPVGDAEWRERFKDEYKKQTGQTLKDIPVYSTPELKDGVFVVPLLNQKISAGTGTDLPEEDEVTALIPVPAYLAKYGKNIAALKVDGDSMYPTLNRGDLVVCDSCGWSGEGIYVLRMGGEGFVKRITKAPGKVVIISDNPKYPLREEPEGSQDLEIIGRVHCAITKME
jgi:phage repressor protein C with HTH and peptisase S24 domain